MKPRPKFPNFTYSPNSSTHSSKFIFPYLFSFLINVVITGLGLLLRGWITPTNLVMPYLLGVVIIAVLWGRGPAIFSSVLGVIAFDIFLVPPYLTFVVEDTEYIITFLSLFLVGVLISSLTVQIKEQLLEAKEREARVTSLYQLSQDLAVAYKMTDVLNAIVDNLQSTLGHDVHIFLLDRSREPGDQPNYQVFPPGEGNNLDGRKEILPRCL